MIKHVPEMTSVVMEEIPDKVTLAVDISNCTGLCEGCHSPFLRRDVGVELSRGAVDRLLSENFGVNCFLFLGEGNDHEALLDIARYIRAAHPALSLAIYSGREQVEDDIWRLFDYVKIGPFRPSCGPLNNPATNQRLYRVHHHQPSDEDATASISRSGSQTRGSAEPAQAHGDRGFTLEDITSRFWHRGLEGR